MDGYTSRRSSELDQIGWGNKRRGIAMITLARVPSQVIGALLVEEM